MGKPKSVFVSALLFISFSTLQRQKLLPLVSASREFNITATTTISAPDQKALDELLKAIHGHTSPSSFSSPNVPGVNAQCPSGSFSSDADNIFESENQFSGTAALMGILGYGCNAASLSLLDNTQFGKLSPVYNLSSSTGKKNLIINDDIVENKQRFHNIDKVRVKRCKKCDPTQFTTLYIKSKAEYHSSFLAQFIDERSLFSNTKSAYVGIGSESYQFARRGIEVNKYVFAITYAFCQMYCASIEAFDAPPLSATFTNLVLALPNYSELARNGKILTDEPQFLKEIKQRFGSFFLNYGTHVITGVVLGSFYGQSNVVEEAKVKNVKPHYFTLHATTSSPRHFAETDKIKQLGAKLHTWPSFVEDASSLEKISYQIQPLTDLLVPDLFPGTPVEVIEQKRKALTFVLDNYYCNEWLRDFKLNGGDCPSASEPPSESAGQQFGTGFGGMYQLSDCPHRSNANVTNAYTGDYDCPPRFFKSQFSSVEWSFADGTKNCSDKSFICKSSAKPAPYAVPIVRYNQALEDEFLKANTCAQDGVKNLAACMKKRFEGAMAWIQNGNNTKCPDGYEEFVYGRFVAWQYVFCVLGPVEETTPPSSTNKILFGGGYQLPEQISSSVCPSGEIYLPNAHQLKTTGVHCSLVNPVTVGLVGWHQCWATQHICMQIKPHADIPATQIGQ